LPIYTQGEVAQMQQTSGMLNAAVEPTQDEVSPLSSCSLIPETKDRADIQTPSSGNISLKIPPLLQLLCPPRKSNNSRRAKQPAEQSCLQWPTGYRYLKR